MGFLDMFRPLREDAPTSEPVTESRGDLPDVTRSGFEYGVPSAGVTTPAAAKSAGQSRQQVTGELYQAYLSCPWVSTCADAVARLVTAGGLMLVPDDGDEDQTRPPGVTQLDELMRFTNDSEDMVQLVRSTVTDLLVFGDGFLELGVLAETVASLWTLDTTTVSVMADAHGNLTGYLQHVSAERTATFDPDEVIHFSLDAPRGGLYGVSPTQKLLVSITTWLFAAACLKEYYRRGMPPRLAMDLGKDTDPASAERYQQQFQARHLGPRNIGQPIITRTGAAGTAAQPPIKELALDQIQQLHETMARARDEIVAGFGLSPSMVGIIESGNLGGGTGESQARTVHYGTVVPLQTLILEKFNFRLLQQAGIKGWHFQFGEVDYRDSKTVEDIREQRLRAGAYNLNDWRAELGMDPVDGGDQNVLVGRTVDKDKLVIWADTDAYAAADRAAALAATAMSAAQAADPEAALKPPPKLAVVPNAPAADEPPADDTAKAETVPDRRARELTEAWGKAFEDQRRKLNRDLPSARD